MCIRDRSLPTCVRIAISVWFDNAVVVEVPVNCMRSRVANERQRHPNGGPGSDLGAHGDRTAVRVHIVADASIMPAIPAANTHLPTVMVAERVAAWLAEA